MGFLQEELRKQEEERSRLREEQAQRLRNVYGQHGVNNNGELNEMKMLVLTVG